MHNPELPAVFHFLLHIGELVRFSAVFECLGESETVIMWCANCLFSESDSSRMRLVTDPYSGVCLSLRPHCVGGFQCETGRLAFP